MTKLNIISIDFSNINLYIILKFKHKNILNYADAAYSTREIAEKKIEDKYRSLPGFCESDGKFIVDEYQIDRDNWEEGYAMTYPDAEPN